MKLIDLARRVLTESGRSGTGPVSVATAQDNQLRAVNAVRDAWLDVQAEPRNWKWMRKQISAGALVAGDMSYQGSDLGASDVSRWWEPGRTYKPRCRDSTNPTNEWPLEWLDYERFQANFLVGDHQAAAPRFWATAPDGSLLVGPKPDLATYLVRIDYHAKPTELVADDDEPNMPAEFHRLLIWKGLEQFAIADGSQEHLSRAIRNAEGVFSALCLSQAEPIRFEFQPLA